MHEHAADISGSMGSRRSSSQRTLTHDELRDLLIGREAPCLHLRVHETAIDRDLEDPVGAFDQFDLDLVEGALKFGDQTGRLRVVVSLHTELDLDVHGLLARLGVSTRGGVSEALCQSFRS